MNISKVEKNVHYLREVFPKTPFEKNEYLSKKYKANIFLKREDLSPVRSYKIRGAYSFIKQATEKNGLKSKFVCASAGNHAQGFAMACNKLHVHGTVFMPTTTPAQKIKMTKYFGGKYIKVVLTGDTFDDAYKASKKSLTKNDTFVPPFDHPEIIAGQATIALELLEQAKTLLKDGEKIDYLLMPVGGGGLSAGISEVFSALSPQTQLVPVEPEGAESLKTALKMGRPVELEKISTFVDGAAVKKIGTANFKVLQKFFKEKDVILSPEGRISETILEFLEYSGIVLEPAGALSSDALKAFHPKELAGKNVVCIVSGGNFDFGRLAEIKEKAQKYKGLRKYVILKLPQRPGALKEFLSILGANDDIIRFEYLKKSSKTFGSVLLGIETDKAENFRKIFSKAIYRMG